MLGLADFVRDKMSFTIVGGGWDCIIFMNAHFMFV
jgi:hypothetical protein